MTQIRGNWQDGISLFSGIISVRKHRDPRGKKDPLRDAQDEDVPTNLKEVIALRPGHRCKWLQRALLLAGSGKFNTTTLYDIVAHPKFTAHFNSDLNIQMNELLQNNLPLFSSRQQRSILTDIKFQSSSDAGTRKRSSSSSSHQNSSHDGQHCRSRSRSTELDPHFSINATQIGHAARDTQKTELGNDVCTAAEVGVLSESAREVTLHDHASVTLPTLHVLEHGLGDGFIASSSSSASNKLAQAAVVAEAVAKAAAVAAQNSRTVAALVVPVSAATDASTSTKMQTESGPSVAAVFQGEGNGSCSGK